MMIAVLMPITSPREDTSGPPELPGLSAASVWITSSISRPVRARSERPSAETTPAVTVDSKPSGLPMAITSWPRRSRLESPSVAAGSVTGASTRTSARSVSGSSPTTRAVRLRPVGGHSSTRAAPPTTWLLVSTSPSGATMTPEPEPARAALPPCHDVDPHHGRADAVDHVGDGAANRRRAARCRRRRDRRRWIGRDVRVLSSTEINRDRSMAISEGVDLQIRSRIWGARSDRCRERAELCAESARPIAAICVRRGAQAVMVTQISRLCAASAEPRADEPCCVLLF